jgi:hypothetical protein
MTASEAWRSTGRRPSLFGALAARAEAWLLEPVEPPAAGPVAAGASGRASPPLVAVSGVARRCGATTVARALAAELGARDPCRAAVVAGDLAGAIPIATPAAARLARVVAGRTAAQVRASGRLCLVAGAELAALEAAVDGLAPVVIDAACGWLAGPASLAGRVVLVADPSVEPALVELVRSSTEAISRDPLVVLNRARPPADGDGERWAVAALHLPDSRAAARLALAGREPPNAFGALVAQLADCCEEPR